MRKEKGDEIGKVAAEREMQSHNENNEGCRGMEKRVANRQVKKKLREEERDAE